MLGWLVALLLLTSSAAVHALKIYQDYIPNGGGFPHHASLGHVSRRAKPSNHRLNKFGKDFKAAQYTWNKHLCQLDSDGDGRTNGQELGDPDCTWFRGDDNPSSSSSIPGWKLTDPSVHNNFTRMAEHDGTLPAVPPPPPATPVDGEAAMDERDDYAAGEAEPTDDFDGGALPTWVVFHAILMFLSFGLILPTAVLFPYYARHRKHWRDEHIKMMLVGGVLALVGFAIAFMATTTGSFHGYLGWVVVSLALVQAGVGAVRRRIALGYGRAGWIKLHSRVGRTVLVLASLQLLLGYVQMSQMLGGNWGLLIWGSIHFVLSLAVVFAVVLKTKMRTYESVDEMGEEEDLGFTEMPNVTTGS